MGNYVKSVVVHLRVFFYALPVYWAVPSNCICVYGARISRECSHPHLVLQWNCSSSVHNDLSLWQNLQTRPGETTNIALAPLPPLYLPLIQTVVCENVLFIIPRMSWLHHKDSYLLVLEIFKKHTEEVY